MTEMPSGRGRAPSAHPTREAAAVTSDPPQPEPDVPAPPPDPIDPLKRDSDDEEETHPGADPVTRPVPPE